MKQVNVMFPSLIFKSILAWWFYDPLGQEVQIGDPEAVLETAAAATEKKSTCGWCQVVGHNARTCSAKKDGRTQLPPLAGPGKTEKTPGAPAVSSGLGGAKKSTKKTYKPSEKSGDDGLGQDYKSEAGSQSGDEDFNARNRDGGDDGSDDDDPGPEIIGLTGLDWEEQPAPEILDKDRLRSGGREQTIYNSLPRFTGRHPGSQVSKTPGITVVETVLQFFLCSGIFLSSILFLLPQIHGPRKVTAAIGASWKHPNSRLFWLLIYLWVSVNSLFVICTGPDLSPSTLPRGFNPWCWRIVSKIFSLVGTGQTPGMSYWLIVQRGTSWTLSGPLNRSSRTYPIFFKVYIFLNGAGKKERGVMSLFKTVYTYLGEQIIIYFTSWMDNKPAHMCSTLGTFQDMVQRACKLKCRYIGHNFFPIPTLIHIYYKFTGGIDGFDQMIQYYRTTVASKRWQIRVFTHFLTCSVVNAHILNCIWHETMRGNPGHDHDLLSFTMMLIEQLATPQIPLRQEKRSRIRASESDLFKSERFAGFHCPHIQVRTEYDDVSRNNFKRKCKVCSEERIRSMCKQCKVGLCLSSDLESDEPSCFSIYHSRDWKPLRGAKKAHITGLV